ncbi:MAG TPA: type VI secretion system contractile sheath large subunit [Sandaracinaceae bacterium LLY-WYZ-13_1]|nr:type VI secretion system contractile sheath large subunit [Sandaracinaceae bacterium LLY-WYZ-13_1]
MATEQEDRGAAQVHWLVAGQFGLGERGETLRLTRGDFNEVLEKAGLSVEAEIDNAASGGSWRVKLEIGSLKSFTLKHVVGAVPELGELAKKADRVAKLSDPTVDQLKELVGEGPLLEAMKALVAPEEAKEPEGDGGDGQATGDVDAIFEKAEVAKPTAKSAIDMFVKSTTSAKKKAKPAARQLRDLIEETVWGMAADVLRAPEVEAVETAWRGLRFLVTECPKDAQMEVILLETDPEHLLEDLGARDRADDIDEPDCIFVPFEYESTGPLAELAGLAEQELIPVVTGAGPALFGCEDYQSIPEAFEKLERASNEDVPEWAQAWDELRLDESTRWLTAVTNRVALHGEGKGVAARTTFGSGVWAIAAMLASSFRNTGGFARIFGKAGSLRAPASHTIDRGSYKDTAAPTEAFYAINPSELLAKNGVLGLGSARNSDTLALTKAPTVRGAKDAVPLPAQILTGRVVRFASWVKAQLPEGCDSKQANDIFVSAASVFLFPGQEEAAHVRAATTNIEGEAHVVVRAVANPAIASVPFEIAFPLPLGWGVPAPETSDEEAETPSEQAQREAGEVTEVKPDPKEGEDGGIASVGVGFDAGLGKKDE